MPTGGVRPICSVEGCERERHNKQHGLCKMHYKRWNRHGHTDPTDIYPTICSIEGCGRKYLAKGYCQTHYSRIIDRGNENYSPENLCITHGATRGRSQGKSETASGSGAYSSWKSMKQRCLYPGNRRYAQYGGAGITICDEWINDFSQFLADMGERPEGKTLDRIDGKGNYEPTNCRWSTVSEQNFNRKTWTRPKKKEGNMTLIENIDKEIKAAKVEVKALNAHIKALEQARIALSGLKKKKTTKSVKAAKKAATTVNNYSNVKAFEASNG